MIDRSIPSLLRAFWANRRPRMTALEQRSVSAILSQLESFNAKRGLLLCDQRLKTNPTDSSALVLKALALYMTSEAKALPDGVKEEILKIVETVRTANKSAALNDVDFLQVLNYVLRETGQGDIIFSLFLEASQKFPNNEEVATEAFLACVRFDERESAVERITSMSKQFQDERFFWWSLLTTIARVKQLPSNHPDISVLLAAAEEQLSTKYAGLASAPPDASSTPSLDNGTDYASAEEFHVVTRLLELRATHSAVLTSSSTLLVLPSLAASDASRTPEQALLAHFASPIGEKWSVSNLGFELWNRESVLKYGTVEGTEWEGLWERLSSQLEQGDINWHTMLYLIRAAFSLASGSSSFYFSAAAAPADLVPSPPSAAGLEVIGRTRECFLALAKDSPKAKVERGFLLGSLEIAREARERKWEEVDSLASLVKEYFDRFSSKMCCFDDLYPYLDVLSASEASSLRDQLAKDAEEATLKTFAEVTRCINGLKVARLLSDESTEEGEKAAAEGYLKRYYETLPLGKDLPPTELQPADDFALLACQAYVSAYSLSHDRSYLERCIMITSTALLTSKYKYQLRILTSNILRLLAAPSLSLTHYRTFGVKNVQHDTLSHLVVGRGSTFAIENAGKEGGVFEATTETEKWYNGGKLEAQEMVLKAFTYGSFSKVEDFSEFRRRIDNSLQNRLVTVEALRMRVVRGVAGPDTAATAIQALKEVLASDPKDLSDNRDYRTLPNYQRKGSKPIWEQTELGTRQDAAWLRAFATLYSRFLSPGIEIVSEEAPTSLTRSEAALFAFSSTAQAVFVAELDKAAEVEQAGLAFFKDQLALFGSAAEDSKTLPWELLQIADVALEAFSLLELGIERRIEEMTVGRLPDQPRHTKRLRAFRANARDLVRSVGAKLTAYSKKVAKERNKILTAVSDLKQFEALNEDQLINVAVALVESRKSAAETLGQTIHRRCIK